MSAPHASHEQPHGDAAAAAAPGQRPASRLIRGAIWIAIGALIAAAVICVIWVLVGDQNGIIGKAFLTVLLLAGFAGVVLLDASLAPKRPDWFVLASMASWVVVLLVGAVKIWLDVVPDGWSESDYYSYGYDGEGIERFFEFLLVVAVLQLALLHLRLFWRAHARYVTTFTRAVAIATTVFLLALVAMLVFFLTFPDSFDYEELYWRIVVSFAILAAVGTTLLPLLNALFAPKRPRPSLAPQQYGQQQYGQQSYPQQYAQPQQWPTYYDGVTPLPVMPDGSPDWNAYYTGQPTYPQGAWPAAQSQPSSPEQPADPPQIPPRPPLPPAS
ncbi:hypothetical protein QWJ90_09435 [Microbacterium oryzae]|uniref:hypothetical protein n=1 Tax=Microbacterium oryzae TaxID=743009 RepID=UPI0025B1B4D5|nr:hypothetical protein [Microbacterium oryzae]MDN3311149.1 hypothetical protein [Microbacterium oryzae]